MWSIALSLLVGLSLGWAIVEIVDPFGSDADNDDDEPDRHGPLKSPAAPQSKAPRTPIRSP